MTKAQKGALGEHSAAAFLRSKGFAIEAANYRTRFGEIDIIASLGKYICFTEVKTRSPSSIAQPSEYVDLKKQKRIFTAAAEYLAAFSVSLQPRFDVIEVFLDDSGNIIKINHIINAFDGDDLDASF